MNSFIRTMVEEKGILHEDLEVTVDGVNHYLTVEVVIEFVESMPNHIQNKVKHTFSKIDFMNGDLMHYINHLAHGMIEATFN